MDEVAFGVITAVIGGVLGAALPLVDPLVPLLHTGRHRMRVGACASDRCGARSGGVRAARVSLLLAARGLGQVGAAPAGEALLLVDPLVLLVGLLEAPNACGGSRF